MIICFFLFKTAVAQKPQGDFSAVDWQVLSVTRQMPDTLAYHLTKLYTTDIEKVRAIYSWICQNISYNADIYKPIHLRKPYLPEPVDTALEWKSGDEMVARKVIRRGVAVCEGYSKLFKVLCEYAGIKAVVINGYVRSDFDRAAERFRTNHAWNAVQIDSLWYLVDVTWAAGYMTWGDEFVQKQNDFYFLTPPAEFIRDHYPDELRWSLLPHPPSLAEFKKMPFRSKSFVKYGISSYFPKTGVIEAEPGDTLSFTLSLKDVKKAKSTFSDPFQDTASFSLSPASVFIKPDKESGNTVYYNFIVDDTTEWVHLLFNDDVILRYNVSRRRSIASN